MFIRVLGSRRRRRVSSGTATAATVRPLRAGEPGSAPHPVVHRGERRRRQRWTLVNASPDILQQFQAFPWRWPAEGCAAAA